MEDYGLQSRVYDMNYASASLATHAASHYDRRYVIGVLGPTSKTLSLSPSVEEPSYRDTTFTEMVTSYAEQCRALLEGGVQVLMVETVFDTLNAKAALFAISSVLEERAAQVPIFVSSLLHCNLKPYC